MQFTKKVISVVISAALVAGPETVVFAQSDVDFSHSPNSGWDSSRLSKAVVTNAQLAVQNYAKKKQLGQVTVADVQTAAFAMKTLFDHYQEIGLNDAIQNRILNNKDAFLNYVPSDSDLQTTQNQFTAIGMSISNDTLRSKFNEGREQFLTMVQQNGIYNTELWYVQQFADQETQNALQNPFRPEGVRANRSMPTDKVIRVKFLGVSPVCWGCGIGFVAGVTVAPEVLPATFLACVMCAAGA
jgi:hypothetical protein